MSNDEERESKRAWRRRGVEATLQREAEMTGTGNLTHQIGEKPAEEREGGEEEVEEKRNRRRF
jgi:hypothetical protein